jgi:hypothetical protein
MRVAAGKRVELLSFGLDRTPEFAPGAPVGHVVIFERRIVAAWVRTIPQGGPFSARDRAGALVSNGDPAPFPPANRFPSGINITAAYELSRAVGLSYKSGGPSAGEVNDQAGSAHLLAERLPYELDKGLWGGRRNLWRRLLVVIRCLRWSWQCSS